jgi:hypothetical protein
MRHALTLAALLLLGACAQAAAKADPAPAPAPTGGVDMATALKIEGKVQLPERAQTLDHYARFYWREAEAPEGIVNGYYVGTDNPPFPTWPKAGIHLEKPNLGVADGGCFVINLTYDTRTDQVVTIRCNGFA